MAGRTLNIVCDLAGTRPESRKFAFPFATFAEIVAGETIVSAVVQFQTVPSSGPPLTAPATGYGLTVGTPAVVGTQVQVQVTASPASIGVAYAFCCSAALSSSPDDLVLRGKLDGEGSL